jgi:NADH dehydrogenase
MQTVFYSVPASDQVREVHYDHLVIALGSTARRLQIPGLAEHAWEMKNLMDAIALRDHAIQMLELAESVRDAQRRTAALQFVIIGGNFTGVELAGQLQELLRQASRYYRHVEAAECRVILIELADRILTPLDQEFIALCR